jgi:CRISPR/Cas system-associated exonuclease Cas4 (RecB family)
MELEQHQKDYLAGYAMAIQAKYDAPKQAFQLLDMERGFTTRIPIFCE